MKGKYTKRDFINLGALSVLYIIIVGCLMGTGKIYGSNLDWANQHWIIPDYFRNRFYETGQFFPSLALETGGGQNIYYLAYYGLHSPFLIISYLLPFIEMRSFIIGINILSVFASVVLFYVWVRDKYSSKVSFVTSVLFLTSAPLIFHSHRHIMFVDYMPFLLLTLIFVRRYFKKKGGLIPIIISSLMIITTSFFFSVGSFIVVGIYSIMLYLENAEKASVIQCVKKIMPIIIGVIVAIAMSGVLLIPTAMALFSGRSDVSSTISLSSLFIPSIGGDFILYGTYSMGLSGFGIYAVVSAGMKKQKQHIFLAAIIGIICVFPIVVYLLNGGMYIDGKVLIPFLPVALLLVAEFLKEIFLKDRGIKTVILIGTIINIVFLLSNLGSNEKLVLAGETALVVICFFIYYRKSIGYIFCIPLMIFSVIVCTVTNLNDDMQNHDYKDNMNINAVSQLVENAMENEENVYRFANCYDKINTVNRILEAGYCQTTIYSSTSNSFFRDFYLNQMKNEVQHRNNAALTTSSNILFNTYMGVKYYMSESAYIPQGYEKIGDNQNVYLYKSEDAYPIGYATSNIILRDEYDKLKYPYTVESLMRYKVVDEDATQLNKSQNIESTIEPIENMEYSVSGNTDGITITDEGYNLDIKGKRELILNLGEPIKDKLIIIAFDVDNDIDGESGDVYVTINDVKNKLTESGWKYHNQNYSFEYIISSNEEIESLDIILSKGKYNISNIKCYTMDYSYISQSRQEMDQFNLDKEKTKGDNIEGTIYVKEDSWFHLSIPYDEGFKVYVDGEETKYSKSDIDFIGFDISKGDHRVVIKYTAPGFNQGVVISLAGIVIFLLILAGWIIKKIREKSGDNESINR